MSSVVIQPYGARLYEVIQDIATELELADSLVKELEALGVSDLQLN